MKRSTLFFILLLATTAFGQRPYVETQPTTIHSTYLEQTVKVESGEIDSIVVEFQGISNINYVDANIDSIASDILPITGWTVEDKKWSGYCEIDIVITNVDLATDSLIVAVYSLDRQGNIRTNDVVYLKLAVFPSYSTSAYYNAWTTALTYRGAVTGAFGMGTHGLLITIDATDETATHKGSARVRVFLK